MDIKFKRQPGYKTEITLCSGNICDKFIVNHLAPGPLVDTISESRDEMAKHAIESKRKIARAYKRGW